MSVGYSKQRMIFKTPSHKGIWKLRILGKVQIFLVKESAAIFPHPQANKCFRRPTDASIIVGGVSLPPKHHEES